MKSQTKYKYIREDGIWSEVYSVDNPPPLDERALVDFFYPVGGDPYIQFPGRKTPKQRWSWTEWEIDETLQGHTLVGSGGSYTFGSMGGSADAVVIEHRHDVSISSSQAGGHSHSFSAGLGNPDGWSDQNVSRGKYLSKNFSGTVTTSTVAGHVHLVSGDTGYTGVSGVGKNMPPYVVVNYWKRIK